MIKVTFTKCAISSIPRVAGTIIFPKCIDAGCQRAAGVRALSTFVDVGTVAFVSKTISRITRTVVAAKGVGTNLIAFACLINAFIKI